MSPGGSPGDKESLLTRDALGAHVILQVVARAQVADDDAACAGAAVDELAVADVDTDVAGSPHHLPRSMVAQPEADASGQVVIIRSAPMSGTPLTAYFAPP